jgi:serine/threonine-protein kinase HipA
MNQKRTSEYREAYVFAASPTGEPALAGVMKITASGGEFTYADSWYQASWAYALDPINLPLAPKTYRVANTKNVFGVFSDAAPDAWGERIMLLKHASAPKNEIERLLRLSGAGVGGIQFSLSRSAPKTPLPLPPIALLGTLAAAVSHIDQKQLITADELRLIEPGSSMGGARPKLSVTEADGTAWLAKFSRSDDVISYPQVEYASMCLLAALGIRVPKVQLKTLNHNHTCYLIQRFDKRPGAGTHFISASALFHVERLRIYDDSRQDPASYVALARIIRKVAQHPQAECEELFARMLANIIINNTDDHARNHGLMYKVDEQKWELSPAYDVLPIVSSQGQQSMGVGQMGRQSSIANALSVLPEMGIPRDKAMEIIDKHLAIFRNWKVHFVNAGVLPVDLQLIANVLDKNIELAITQRQEEVNLYESQ